MVRGKILLFFRQSQAVRRNMGCLRCWARSLPQQSCARTGV